MINIADQLFQAAESAASMAGGGGDDNTPPNAGGFNLVKRGGDYVALDNSGKEIARSQDQNTAMQRAKSYLRNPPSPVQAQPSEAMAPLAEVSENPVIPQQNYPTNPYQLNQQLQPVQPRQPGQFDATPMQTRMPQASTIDPAQAVLQGAAQTAGAAAVTPQGTTTATTGAVPGQEAPEEQRRRGRSSWSAPGRTEAFTQEDFYPNPQDPAQYGYSTGLEVIARPGRMPMGAISKAATILNNRQVELNEKRQAFIDDLYKPIKTATPYQQNFNVIVNKQREDFVKSVADAYTGGDVNKAYRQIFSSPQLRNQWRQINADLEALGQRGGEIFARAEKYLADAATNTIGSTPEMRKLARDIMYGMGGYASPDGTGGDFNTLIKNIKQFEMMEGRDRYFRDTVTKSVKDFAERLPYTADGKKPYVITAENRYRFITQGHRQTFINQIKQIARDMAVYQGYGEGADLTARIADNEKFLMAMLPDQYDLTTTVEDTYANISRGGGQTEQTIPMTVASVTERPSSATAGQFAGPRYALKLTPHEQTGKKQVRVVAAPLYVGEVAVNVAFPDLEWDEQADSWVITGNDLGVEYEYEQKAGESTEQYNERVKSFVNKEKSLVARKKNFIKVPAADNAAFLRSKFGTENVYQIVASQIGASPEEVQANWNNEQYRNKVIQAIRSRTGAAPAAPAPSATSAQSSDGAVDFFDLQ